MIARATADLLFEWDLQSHRLWWGGGLTGRFGDLQDCVEIGREAWLQRIHPEDRERVLRGVDALVGQSATAWSDEFRVLCPDGKTAFVLGRGLVSRDQFQRPLKLTGGMCDISARRECEQSLDQSRRQLRALSSRSQNLREEDRRRISRDLHDTLGQILTGLKMDLGWIEKNIAANTDTNPALLEKLMETEDIVDSAITEVQRIATDYRPDVLDNLGLASAIKCELELLQQRSGMQCHLEMEEGLPEPSPGISIGLFRILQEALTNVVRHARAGQVMVKLRRNQARLEMEVLDNGVGIDPTVLIRPGALGLLGMKEHATLLGGELELKPGESQGTKLIVLVPFHEPTTSIWDLPS
ncbi:MAG: PAS domain-containing protein [Verrucomicrobiales bacterium]|nr:PAS domain-containing protein [Verrucomicrobiales bacterium]